MCSCLLSCWNSALSANPFNSLPAVFVLVWTDVLAPDKWLDSLRVITRVSGHVIPPLYYVLYLVQLFIIWRFPMEITLCTDIRSVKSLDRLLLRLMCCRLNGLNYDSSTKKFLHGFTFLFWWSVSLCLWCYSLC